jgi:hypothetical protein
MFGNQIRTLKRRHEIDQAPDPSTTTRPAPSFCKSSRPNQ